MDERALARILLVRACEEGDPEARHVSRASRERASREARAEASTGADEASGEAFLARRADRLARDLAGQHASLRGALAVCGLRVPGALVALGALAVGLGIDALGGLRRINLLAFPLLGLVVWNLGAYAALAFQRLATSAAARPASRLARASLWLVSPERFWMRRGGADETRWLAGAQRRFASHWLDAAGALLAARGRRLLHLGAAGIALGVVLGMYVQGFAFEYRASWESTFLDAAGVERLLGVVLGPASALLGAPLPDAAGIDALRAPGDGPAAVWIHRWALTALLAIVLPRLALVVREGLRARALTRSLHPRLDDAYALRLLAPDRGQGVRARLQPYSHHPTTRALESLRELVLELFGNRAELVVAEPLGYGDELAEDAQPERDRCTVAVFSLAQSPEQEVHGEFLDALKGRIEASPGSSLLVVLDEEPYLKAGGDAERLAERRRSWERLARACELSLVGLGPAPEAFDQALEHARDALWPVRPGEAA